MPKYYKFLVHLGDDTYHNIMLGDQLTVMSDVEKPMIPPIIDNIELKLVVDSTVVDVRCTNYNEASVDIGLNYVWITTSSAQYDIDNFENEGWYEDSVQGSIDTYPILYFNDGCAVESVSIGFNFNYNGIKIGDLSVEYN